VPLTLDQAVMISQRIWRNATSLPRERRLVNLRRARQLVELAEGRERIARRNSTIIYARVAVSAKGIASTLADIEAMLQIWKARSQQAQADPDYLGKLDFALALLDESRSMPDFLAKLKERL
jgi:hypothetical protein